MPCRGPPRPGRASRRRPLGPQSLRRRHRIRRGPSWEAGEYSKMALADLPLAQNRASLRDLWLRKCQRTRPSKRSASMRWICWAGLLIVVALAAPALAGHHHWSAYSMGYGVPCPTPCLAPGCCEHQTSCCENVWAGFCDEKAKCRHRRCGAVGAGAREAGCDCGGVGGGTPATPAAPGAPTPYIAPPAAAPGPTPAPPPAPPAPKTTRLGNYYHWPG